LKKPLLAYVAIGMALVAAAIAILLYATRGAHIDLRGKILKVRTLPIEAGSFLAVIDFRFVNPSDYPFVVRKVDVFVGDDSGTRVESTTVSEVDAKRLFEYYPILGPKYNETLTIRTKVGSRQSMDRMIAVRFDLPVSELERRKNLLVRVEDVDGAVSEITGDAKNR
jgi:hypothetical protein